MYFGVEILDGNDKQIQYLSRNSEPDEDNKLTDFSSFSLDLKIDNKFKGGVYKIKFNGSNSD